MPEIPPRCKIINGLGPLAGQGRPSSLEHTDAECGSTASDAVAEQVALQSKEEMQSKRSSLRSKKESLYAKS